MKNTQSTITSRAIYGFVLYLFGWIGFILYIVWAYVDDKWLNAMGIYYFPQKYWAISAPTYLCVCMVFLISFYATLNITSIEPLNSLCTIADSHSKPLDYSKIIPGSIPPISDFSITEINEALYY